MRLVCYLYVFQLSSAHCCMRYVAMYGVSSHCSSLPPCSEMMFEQVILIHPFFRDHTSRAVCSSISTCMCDAIQFCNLLLAGRALFAMADDKQPTRPWKRVVTPLAPDWMSASVGRLEEARAETLDSARKRHRETPREGDEEMAAASESAAAASSASGQPTALPSSVSLPPRVSEDMRKFRYVSMTSASFAPTGHLFMCAGRPMVVACFMYSPTPPSFLMRSLCDVPKEAPQHNPMVWDCTGALSMQLLGGPMHHSESLPMSLKPFFSEPLVRVFIYTHGVYWLLLSGARHEPRARERGRN